MARTKNDKAADEATADTTHEQAQAAMDVETEQGFRGNKVDPTPDENYTLAGVTSGLPTPETDPEYRREVRAEMEQRAEARTLRPETVEQ